VQFACRTNPAAVFTIAAPDAEIVSGNWKIDPCAAGWSTFDVAIKYCAAGGMLADCCHVPSPRKYAPCLPADTTGTNPATLFAVADAPVIMPGNNAQSPSPDK
jgi:hypothetical protein